MSEQYRQQWSTEAKRDHRLAKRNIWRFVCFMVAWLILAAVVGAVMHR